MATVDNNSAFDQFVQFWSKTNKKGQNTMYIAALHGFWNLMDSLLQCSPHPERLCAPASSDNYTPLQYAVKGGSPIAVQILLRYRVLPTREETGDIMKILLYGKHPNNISLKILELLLIIPGLRFSDIPQGKLDRIRRRG